MIPLLAATSAVSAVSSVAESAVTVWQDLMASRSASKLATQGANPGQGAAGSASDSFSALLSAQGVGEKNTGSAGQAGALQDAGQHGTGHHGGHHHLDHSV